MRIQGTPGGLMSNLWELGGSVPPRAHPALFKGEGEEGGKKGGGGEGRGGGKGDGEVLTTVCINESWFTGRSNCRMDSRANVYSIRLNFWDDNWKNAHMIQLFVDRRSKDIIDISTMYNLILADIHDYTYWLHVRPRYDSIPDFLTNELHEQWLKAVYMNTAWSRHRVEYRWIFKSNPRFHTSCSTLLDVTRHVGFVQWLSDE